MLLSILENPTFTEHTSAGDTLGFSGERCEHTPAVPVCLTALIKTADAVWRAGLGTKHPGKHKSEMDFGCSVPGFASITSTHPNHLLWPPQLSPLPCPEPVPLWGEENEKNQLHVSMASWCALWGCSGGSNSWTLSPDAPSRGDQI